MNPSEIATNIHKAWSEFVEKDQSAPSKRPYVYASSHWDCLRRMVLDMTHGDKLPSFDAETLARFRRGNDRERDLVADLKRIGRNSEPPFEVIGEQERFELKDREGRTVIVGKKDCSLKFGHNGENPPVEVKSWSPNLTARIKTFEDCFISPWTRKGAFQLLAYLFGTGEPYGFLLLDKSGLPSLIPVELNDTNLERMESFLSRATRAMDHKEADTLPDYHDEPAECKRCSHFGVNCSPPLKYEGASIITDEILHQELEERSEHEESAKKFKALDASVKAKLRGVENAVAGDFLIQGAWQRKIIYDHPAIVDAKAKHRTVDPKGKFVLKILKI